MSVATGPTYWAEACGRPCATQTSPARVTTSTGVAPVASVSPRPVAPSTASTVRASASTTQSVRSAATATAAGVRPAGTRRVIRPLATSTPTSWPSPAPGAAGGPDESPVSATTSATAAAARTAASSGDAGGGAARGGGLRRGAARQLERRVVLQDGLLQPPQLRPRLEADLLVEHPPRRGVGLERLGLPPRPVQRDHELRVEALAQRVAPHERPQLRHQRVVAPEREVGVDAQLERLLALLVELGQRRRGERLVLEVAQEPAAPQRERGTQFLGGLRGPARLQVLAPRPPQRGEPPRVGLLRRDRGQVAGRARHHAPRAARARVAGGRRAAGARSRRPPADRRPTAGR